MNRVLASLALAGFLILIGLQPHSAFAWCTPRILHCGDVIDSSTVQGHDDVNTYNCTGSTTWNGKAHVYKISHAGDSLWVQLIWTGNSNHALGLFLLSSCDNHACIAYDPHYIARSLPHGDYWIVVDSRADAGTSYELRVFCGDHQLPVELLSFTASDAADGMHLAWSTASETNSGSFRLERQLQDTDDWTLLGSVPAQGQTTSRTDYSFVDPNVIAGMEYAYRLVSVDVNGEQRELQLVVAAHTSVATAVEPAEYQLIGNFPNPFNPTTSITFDVKTTGVVTLKVFNMVGQEVATLVNGTMAVGRHSVNFNAVDLPSGLYLCRMEAQGFSDTKKMVLMK